MSLATVLGGIGGSLYAAKSARKAANRQASALEYAAAKEAELKRALAEPFLREAEYALPLLHQFIERSLIPASARQPKLFDAVANLNITQIERNRNRALAESTAFWNALHNPAHARGERLRINQAALDAANQARIGSVAQQFKFSNESIARLVNVLSKLAELGAHGDSFQASAAEAERKGISSAALLRQSSNDKYYSALQNLFTALASVGSKKSR